MYLYMYIYIHIHSFVRYMCILMRRRNDACTYVANNIYNIAWIACMHVRVHEGPHTRITCRHRVPKCFKHAGNVRLRMDIGSKQPFIKRFAPVTPQACDELVWRDQPVVRCHQDRCTFRTLLHTSAC